MSTRNSTAIVTQISPLFVNNDVPRVRKSDPITSHMAADSNRNRMRVEDRVFWILAEAPLTDHELTAVYEKKYGFEGIHPDSPRKRRSDLLDKGIVYATDELRTIPPHGPSRVWATGGSELGR